MANSTMCRYRYAAEDLFIYIFIGVVVLMIALALYGYLSGRWEQLNVT